MLSAKTNSTSYPLSDTSPLAIDLYCGLGGWAEGFLSEGYRVIGFDIERHDYGTGGYPGQLVIQDVRTLHGSQFKDAAVIVASPPCQAYSYRAMPWKRAKALPPPDNTLFEQPFRIQREACEAAGRYIPLIVENVRGAQEWLGSAKWHYGSFYLWGDVPALMPTGWVCKQAGTWFYNTKGARQFSSHSKERKRWSAQIAKIPFPLAQHIARVFKPVLASLLLVALFNPLLSPQKATPMFVLSEIARKRYAQFSFDFQTYVTRTESKSELPSEPITLEPGALPPALDELAKKYRPFIDRVLTRLSEAERKEVNSHLRQDIRQAWITVSYAQRMSDAFVQASYLIYGKHPDQIWPSIVADRKARLAGEYHDWYDGNDMPRPDVPRIPVVKVVDAAKKAADPTSNAGAPSPSHLNLPPILIPSRRREHDLARRSALIRGTTQKDNRAGIASQGMHL